ncbi:hypothetical protein SCALIN_C04_0043 [Candidatus Scalindua japonica]|uniref:DUF2442 domain-containing protein n=1 Tax=Candidatus Scalindua japonica TaxID=1284222 RepID=A0A286TUN2_9BACT|nr:DUF2442 domain-containing protein [Candidatus Scalindua japonica]GAX59555.1 hypothetical protein SCALIN_C04_0043 [Candidatus Scalindua japonica]
MSTLIDMPRTACFRNGEIIIYMKSGAELRFPVAKNLRLAKGTARQLNNIEISPFGVHWPDLDEDLSFRGIADGDYGQRRKKA